MHRRHVDNEIARLDPEHRIAELEIENAALRRQRDQLLKDQTVPPQKPTNQSTNER